MTEISETSYQADAARVRNRIEGRGLSAYVLTFGCQQNEADSEKLRAIAADCGYLPASSPEEASLILVNTCAIRHHAEEKALSTLGTFRAIKKKNPGLLVGVCGCMAAEPGMVELLKKDFHYVSFTLEPNRMFRLPTLILRALEQEKRTFLLGEDDGGIVEGLPTVRTQKHRAWVSIMYGCNNFCSYCVVPYVRGRERSRESAAILAECEELVREGCREITLLGQNVNSYRSDLDFPGLLEKIAEIPGDFLIRFMTSHPKDVSDGLLSVMAEHREKIAPYFHLPLQSGSNRILRAMNRTYTREKYLDTVNRLRKAVPGIALSTDVIIGFPGESDEDFEDTMRVLEDVRFDLVYSFIFSPREGTRAAKMEDPVAREVSDRRMARLLARQGEISSEVAAPLLGRVVRVLVDSEAKRSEGSTYSGRTDTNKLVHFDAEPDLVGSFVFVKIEKTGGFDLVGKIVKEENHD